MYMNDRLHIYSNIVSSINGFDIMVTLHVHFEYIKILCEIFTKYILPILQIYPNYFIICLKIITNDIYYYLGSALLCTIDDDDEFF
jgi:hypothetical protein